jgi:hypothetical protein|tara:strand:- start:463 stop:1590 length:1128 start_codon:yes stop_codon:yes gene_type:complete
MELAIVKYIKEHGLEATIDDFKLKFRDYGHKVILKYDQIKSSYQHEETRDARGLVLEKGTWKVMSMTFRKFFNTQEGFAAKIDWDNTHVYEKCDGTLIGLYWDWVLEKWCVGTTGTAEAEGDVNSQVGFNFEDLFWQTAKKIGLSTDDLVKGNTFMFELMTPYNIVVTPHDESKLTLLAIRNLNTLEEYSHSLCVNYSSALNVPFCNTFKIEQTNVGWLQRKFKDMSMFEEGFVICDADFNRVKVKNPAYVEAHHEKSKTGIGVVIKIIQTNEIDEWLITAPERKEEVLALKTKYDSLEARLEAVWVELQNYRPKNITSSEKKKFASKVFELCDTHKTKSYSGLYFQLDSGRVASVKDFLFDYDSKKLFKMLENE